jgi:hypothetical protein
MCIDSEINVERPLKQRPRDAGKALMSRRSSCKLKQETNGSAGGLSGNDHPISPSIRTPQVTIFTTTMHGLRLALLFTSDGRPTKFGEGVSSLAEMLI